MDDDADGREEQAAASSSNPDPERDHAFGLPAELTPGCRRTHFDETDFPTYFRSES